VVYVLTKKIGLIGGVSTGVGFIIATSCFISLASGASKAGSWFILAMVACCLINMLVAMSIAELNALMPNLTGGLAQYTMVSVGPFIAIVVMVGGYLVSNIFAGPAEAAMFANVMHNLVGTGVPEAVYAISITAILIFINLMGVNVSTTVQIITAVFMVFSLLVFGIIGAFQLGVNPVVVQDASLVSNDILKDVLPLMSVAFWLFIGSEFVIPLGKEMHKPKRNVPLAMLLTLGIMCVIQVLMVVGFKFYTPWGELAVSASPHVLYGLNILGEFGRYWIIAVALFAAVSTLNSIINSVSEICCGMANINLLPAVFQKKNRRKAPYMVIIPLGIIMILVEASGQSTGSEISFLILTSSFFWMLSYIVSHINVLVLRKKMKNVPRTFKAPLVPFLPVVGILATAYMIWNISTDPQERLSIFILSGILFLIIALYAVFWIKFRLKLKLFRGVEPKTVMAMEDPLYHHVRKIKKEETT
jgi:amino acid transporter